MSSDPQHTITPVLCGMIEDTEWSNLVLKRHIGDKIAVPCIMWVVRGDGRTVIVDSGPGDPQTVELLTGRELKQDESPAAALDRLGIRVRDISALVLSHLHWDHSGGLDLFPEARIYVQRRELQWAIAPPPIQEAAFEWSRRDGELPRWLKARSRMKVIEGDLQLAPGLRLIHLPGHTPGCMGLCCSTAAGAHLIACDAVPTFENLEQNVPPGWYFDLDECYRSLAKAREIAEVVLPAHDIAVFRTATYPAETPQNAPVRIK